MVEQYLAGRTALVTGAAGGIGVEHARALAARGARLVLADRSTTPELTALAAELDARTLGFDLADQDDVRRAVSELAAPIDVVIANHAYMSMAPFLDAEPDDWWRVVDTNLTGTRTLLQALLPAMPDGGRVVVMSSAWGVTGWPEATAYAASKSGLIALTKTLARELAPRRIGVNAVAPGVIETPQLQVDADAAGISLAEMKRQYAEQAPAGRIGLPQEVAQVVAFLADPRLGALTGQTVQINGAELRCRV